MGTSDSSKDVEFVSPGFTITERHSELLDEIVSFRYPNRSHALRVAIEDLHQSVTSDTEQPLQSLANKADDMSSSIDNIEEIVSEIQSVVRASPPGEVDWERESAANENHDQPFSDAEINRRVYEAISETSSISFTEIVEITGASPPSVKESLVELIDQNYVGVEMGEYGALYQPTPATNN